MNAINTLPAVPAQNLRSVDLPEVVKVLRSRRAQSLDVVVPTNTLLSSGGNIAVAGLDNVLVPGQTKIDENGVTSIPPFEYDPSGLYRPTSIVDQQLADLFKIPVRYIRKLRAEDVELLDININRHANRAEGSSLLRLIWGSDPQDDSTTGIVRAILSDRYGIIDHLDTVVAILEGLRGLEVEGVEINGSNIKSLDLSDRKLYLNIEVPEIAVHGRELVENYRSPFTGQFGSELPLVHAGIKITNSEVGHGAFEVKPYALFEVCSNGATIDGFGLRKVHIGKQLDQGQVKWSNDTLVAATNLVKNQVKDAVGQFLSKDFLQARVDEWRELAGVEVPKADDTIKVIGKELGYSEKEQDDILSFFIKGADTSAFGLGHAVTAVAQNIEDADRAHEFAETHLKAATLAAREAAKA